MSVEFPEPRRELTELEWQNLKSEAIHWRETILETINKGASRSYSHIFGTIAFGMNALIETADTPAERRDDYYQDTSKYISYIKRYYKLLEDFPEFAEKELKEGNGYFPELYRQLHLPLMFIDAYEERLRGGSV